jgi:hypothetical protein
MRRLTEAERAEREATRAQQFAEKRAAREAKRVENKARWLEDDARNANVRHKKMVEATAPEIAEPTSRKSTEMLERIMNSPGTAVGLRIDSAEALLSYQQAPGSMALAETSAEAIAAGSAYTFLKQLSVTPGLAQPLQIKCLRLLANIEAIKARSVDANEVFERRKTAIALINSARRMALVERGTWHSACISGASWSITAADDVEVPTLSQSNGNGIAAALEHALAMPREELERRRQVRRELLLAIEAKGRDDDWRALLTRR